MFLKKSTEELGKQPLGEAGNTGKMPVIVILDEVRSMHNVGSAFRTADAFAVEAIYLCGYTPQPPHRDIHKTALGATETVQWKHFGTTIGAVQAARQAGYKIFTVEQAHNSIPLNQFDPAGHPVALVFGNEVVGVDEEVMGMADGCVEIPQWGAKHSMNISVTVGVVLWELARKRSVNITI